MITVNKTYSEAHMSRRAWEQRLRRYCGRRNGMVTVTSTPIAGGKVTESRAVCVDGEWKRLNSADEMISTVLSRVSKACADAHNTVKFEFPDGSVETYQPLTVGESL